MTWSKVWRTLRWVLPAVLIITGGFLVAGGILRLTNIPSEWSEYNVTAEFPNEVSYTSLMTCLDSIPEIEHRFGHKPIISITITETADDVKLIRFNPVPSSTEEIKSALEKQLKAKIMDEHTIRGKFSPSNWSLLDWLEFVLAFLAWPALLFLGAGELIKFYRGSA